MKSEKISQLLKEERNRTQMKLEDVIEASGVNNIKQIEDGNGVSITRLFKIFDVYTTPTELIYKTIMEEKSTLSNADFIRFENEILIRGLDLNGDRISSNELPFRALVYQYRTDQNMDAEALAQELYVSKGFVNNLELQQQPTLKMVYAVPNILNIPAEKILGAIEKMDHFSNEKKRVLVDYYEEKMEKEQAEKEQVEIEAEAEDESENESSGEVENELENAPENELEITTLNDDPVDDTKDNDNENNDSENNDSEKNDDDIIDIHSYDVNDPSENIEDDYENNNTLIAPDKKTEDDIIYLPKEKHQYDEDENKQYLLEVIAHEQGEYVRYRIVNNENRAFFIMEWERIMQNQRILFIRCKLDNGSEVFLNIKSIIAVKLLKVTIQYI